jgi:hypothetical protein
MDDQRPGGSTRERLLFLVFGALLGVFPVFAASYLQTRAQTEQYLRDRRLAALKDYSTTCARAIGSAQRFLELEAILKATGSRKSPAQESWEHRQIEIIRGELAAIQVERRVTRDVINALFRVDLELLEFLPRVSSGPRPQREVSLVEAIPRFSRQCDETVQRLALFFW